MRSILFSCACFALLLALAGTGRAQVTDLTNFVWNNDGAFAWNISTDSPVQGDGYTVYNLYLTSTTYLTPEDSSGYLWHHWVQVCIADDMRRDENGQTPDLAFLWNDGGRTKSYDRPPGDVDMILRRVCLKSRVISVGIYQIPNQPIVFADDPAHKSRTEDALMAAGWRHVIDAGGLDTDWLLRYPMVKAVIKSIDAVQDFVPSLAVDGLTKPERFIVAGASKRGLTANLAGVVRDERVVGVGVVVAPFGGLVEQMNSQWRSTPCPKSQTTECKGSTSWALQDYVDIGIMPSVLNCPVFGAMYHTIDPLTYQEELAKINKLFIVALNDEFFAPDADRWFYSKIPGEKQLRVVPSDHALIGYQFSAIDGAIQWGLTMITGQPRPTYSYETTADGRTTTLTVDSPYVDQIIDAQVVWTKNNPHRDFRLITCAQESFGCLNRYAIDKWSEKLESAAPGVYKFTMPDPNEGHYSVYFLQVKFDLGIDADSPFIVTSGATVLPMNVYPYPPCDDATCRSYATCNQTGPPL
jgi:PhoPQ-activated pathogenicity-related protein